MSQVPSIALTPPIVKPPVRRRLIADLCPGCGLPEVDNVDCRCAE